MAEDGERNVKWFPTKGIKILKESGYLKMFIYLFMAAFRLMKVPVDFLSPIPPATQRQKVVITLLEDDDEEIKVKKESLPVDDAQVKVEDKASSSSSSDADPSSDVSGSSKPREEKKDDQSSITCAQAVQMYAFMALMEKVFEPIQQRIQQECTKSMVYYHHIL